MKETFYFTHDYNARNDLKLVKVRKKYGHEGYGIYWILVEMMYEHGGKLPFELEDLAYELRTEAGIIKSIIEDFGLFKKDDTHFWSDSVIGRLKARQDKQEKARQSANSRWGKGKNDANALPTQSDRNAKKESKGKEIKEKESKEEEIGQVTPASAGQTKEDKIHQRAARQKKFGESLIPFMETFGKEMIREFFNYWIEPNKSGTRMRWEMERTWELKLRLENWQRRSDKFATRNGKNVSNDTTDKAADKLEQKLLEAAKASDS